MQDSLLSRFNLMMIMLDVPDCENDILISDHVMHIHKYRDPKEQDGEASPLNEGVDVLSTKILEIDITSTCKIDCTFLKNIILYYMDQ